MKTRPLTWALPGESVSSEVTELYNIPAGVLVGDVVADGPAEEAGLQKGDIITAFDGVTITSMEDLQNRLQYYTGGETVDMDDPDRGGRRLHRENRFHYPWPEE